MQISSTRLLLNLLLVFSFLITSCDNDKVNPTPDTDECKITKIEYVENGIPDGSVSEFEYNEQGYVVRETEAEGIPPEVFSDVSYVYNSNNQIIRQNYNEDSGNEIGYMTYEYNADGTLNKIVNFQIGKQPTTETYTYDANKRVIQIINTKGYRYKTTLQYIGNSENISKKTIYSSNNQIVETNTYENYDDKQNPIKVVKGYEFVPASRNNPGKITTINSFVTKQIVNISYKYNNSGLPTEIVEKVEGGTDEFKSVFTYTGCK